MTAIKNLILSFLILITSGCIEPNTEELWSISVVGILNTTGFARDVAFEGNTAFVAAGQSGMQIWDLENQSRVGDFTGYYELETFLEFDDLSLIEIDTINNLIFSAESNKDVQIFSYTAGDTDLNYVNTIMSAKTKEFVPFSTDSGRFVMYTADNDDGLKWSIYEPYIFWGDTVWNPVYPEGSDGELYTPGKPQGIDSDGENYIAMAVDQLGVELYSIDSLGADPELLGRVDTEGNAEQVTLTANALFAACDDAGAYFIPTETFSGTGTATRFAQDLTVDHIAIHNGIAALSLGAKGIALYDISEPSAPIEKGIFPIGYTYRSKFWGEKLVVCSREGLQILTIKQ